MHFQDILFGVFVYLAAAVLALPLAKRLGFGSVLGYLVAGIVIGPFVLGLVGAADDDIMHVAEFGVVMMLFLIGLELRPAILWRLRKPILGLGGLQVVTTAAVIAGGAMALGLAARPALAVGLILALSSTAIVLQSLAEQRLISTEGGRSAFSVLLFQDVAFIPILALLPFLATGGAEIAATPGAEDYDLTSGLPVWLRAVVVLATVAGIIIAGRLVMRPVFRAIAATQLREAFTATALLIVVGVALLMIAIGLSPALGAFIAGVVLADSEYRHELEMDLEPFKGLLLGLFFVSVGASIDFALIMAMPLLIAGAVVALMVAKFAVLAGLARLFGLGLANGLLFAVALAQGGEFAFVLAAFAAQNGVLPGTLTNPLMAVVAITMALTPLALLTYERLVRPRIVPAAAREPDVIDDDGHPVIIAGYGRFGMTIGRLLAASGFNATVLDYDPAQIDLLRRLGQTVFYGDAARPEILRAAGAERAKLLVIAVGNTAKADEIADTARKHFPHLEILVRAYDRRHAYRLINRGYSRVYRETFGTSLEMAVDALTALGLPARQAQRSAQIFREHDTAAMHELAPLYEDENALLAESRRRRAAIERVLREDRAQNAAHDGEADTSGAAQEPAKADHKGA